MWLKLFYQRQVLNDKVLIGISRYSEIAERLFHRHHIGNRKQLLVFILIINRRLLSHNPTRQESHASYPHK